MTDCGQMAGDDNHHMCVLLNAHEGNHVCVCGYEWPTVGREGVI